MTYSDETSCDLVVSVKNLIRDFGEKRALKGINLNLAPGNVMGLLGENGAGKTTLIKHLLGLLKAQSGSVRVFGKNPVEDPVGVLSRIGYLSEEPDLPGWMTITELMRYQSAFYASWDMAYANQLLDVFELNPKARIKTLSKGQRARTGLVAAQAFRPDLLLLDEPSSGLDPIVRRDILNAIIRTVAEEGRTVLFSSHLLEEVEQVSDLLTMITSGNIVLSGTTDDILMEHHAVVVRCEREEEPRFEGMLKATPMGKEWLLHCRGDWDFIQSQLQTHDLKMQSQRNMSLNDIFVAHSGKSLEQVAS